MRFKKYLHSFLFLLLLNLFIISADKTNAQTATKEYHYQKFDVEITVNPDSTFDVTETQTYYLNGNFGFFYRDIPRKKLDHFSNIEVLDENLMPIPENELDINWSGNYKHIQWNFDRRDFNQETKTWTVKYKIHGGLDFYDNKDEIYWNAIPHDREVPIKNLTIRLHLPPRVTTDTVQTIAYNESELGGYIIEDENTLLFLGQNIPDYENFTIATSWSKGAIQRPLFYREQLINWIILITAIAIPLLVLVFMIYKWNKIGREPKIDKTISARYEPPEPLPAGVVETIVNQSIAKSLSATVIDLARRGFMQIQEEDVKLLSFPLGKNFIIKKLKEVDKSVYPHEKKAFKFLFPSLSSYEFSTKDVHKKRSPHSLNRQLKKFRKSVFADSAQTKYFTGDIQKIRGKYSLPFVILLILSIFSFIFLNILVSAILGDFWVFRMIMLDVSLFITAIIGFIIAHHMPALTPKGAKQKYEWLCFKEYLKTAEKYRLESETPETFSLFLPYAMVLGAEEAWIKKFAPIFEKEGWHETWYVSSRTMTGGPARHTAPAVGGTFSATDFTNSMNSFISSFSRSFSSSSSGGGASGGGGSSGGGGGGGGGGGAG